MVKSRGFSLVWAFVQKKKKNFWNKFSQKKNSLQSASEQQISQEEKHWERVSGLKKLSGCEMSLNVFFSTEYYFCYDDI